MLYSNFYVTKNSKLIPYHFHASAEPQAPFIDKTQIINFYLETPLFHAKLTSLLVEPNEKVAKNKLLIFLDFIIIKKTKLQTFIQ